MGHIRPVEPAALVSGVFYADATAWERARAMLIDRFGPIEEESEPFAFVMTDYYQGEMGAGLTKQFCLFEEPIIPDRLPAIKHSTNVIEQQIAKEWGTAPDRAVNIDPGYVTAAKLVLASTKDYSHRVYLGDGIYGEVTLRCIAGRMQPIDTTYPDYSTSLALSFFNSAREYVKRNRQQWMSETA